MITPRRSIARVRIPMLYALVALGIFSATRLALALWTGLDAVPLALWPQVFAKGLFFDAVVTLVLLSPVWLHDAIVPDRWRASRVFHVVRTGGFAAAVYALMFIAVAEATFWLEFATRFNFIAVDYLLYTHEVVGNIRESYPVGWILAAMAVI